MANAIIGMGTKLEYKVDSSWFEVARLENIGEFDMGDVDDIEVTTYDSADGYKEYIPGLADAGELEITGVWTADTTQTELDDLRGKINDWRITLPNNLGVFEFKGYLKGPRITPSKDDKITFSATIKITGKPVFTV